MTGRPMIRSLRRGAVPGLGVLLLTTVVAVTTPTAVHAAVSLCSDGTGPVLTDLGRSPAAVNVTLGDKKVTVTASATDDLSGVASIYVLLTSPVKQGVARTASASLHRVSGTSTNGDFSGTATIRRWTIDGTWHISSVYLTDRVGNSTYYFEPQLMTAGYPTTEKVTSKPDLAKPKATGFAFTPKNVDTRKAAKTVKVTATIKDTGGSGVSSAYVFFSRSTKKGSHGATGFLTKKKGTANTYTGTVKVPRFADEASPVRWKAGLTVFDKAGNYRSYDPKAVRAMHWPTTLKVTTTPDKVPPTLKSLSVNPKAVDVSASAKHSTATGRATDKLSGTRSFGVTFTRVGGFESLYGYLRLKSGNPHDGTWKGSITVRLCQAPGTYAVSSVTLTDVTGNQREYSATQLAAMGIKTKLTVSS